MKILVDQMPKNKEKCLYCKDNSCMDFDEYICIWQNNNHLCFGVDECPYFKALERNK